MQTVCNTISRGVGYAVDGGYIVGGGCNGLTEELDATVSRCGEWLREHFPESDIQIRFNSDRKSGGAFIESSHDLDGEVYVKFGARLVSSEISKCYAELSAGTATFEELEQCIRDAKYDKLVVEVGVNLEHTRNTCGGTPSYGDILWLDFPSFEEAASYITNNIQEVCDHV